MDRFWFLRLLLIDEEKPKNLAFVIHLIGWVGCMADLEMSNAS